MLDILLLPLLGGVCGGVLGIGLERLKLPDKASLALIAGLAAAFSAVFGVFGILHYEAMNAHQTDLALMDQMAWNSLHGQLFRTTLQGIGVSNFLAFHVEPIMVLISPLYLLFPSAGMLVVLQTLGLGVSAIPLALWARKRLECGWLPLLVGLAFLLSPVLANNNDLFFEEIPLAVPFLTWAFYFQLQRRWRPFAICLLLALCVREEIAFVAMALGLYALLVQKQRVAGWATLAGGFVWAVVSLGVIIPAFNHGQGLYWATAYGYLGGDTPLEIAWNALTHPWLVVQHVVSAPRLEWLLRLLVPLGFLPLIGWRVSWLALPTLAYLLMGNGYYDPNSWYPDPMLPFLYFGAIEGIAALRRFVPPTIPASYLAGVAAVSFYLHGAGPGTRGSGLATYEVTAHARASQAMLATIPPQARVAATPQIIAHVSHRLEVSIFPELLIPEDVFAIDFVGWRGWHGYPAWYDEYDQALRRVLHDPEYGAFYQGDGLLLLKRGIFPAPPAHPASVQLGGKVAFLGYDTPDAPRPGQPFTIHLRWKALQPLDQQYTISLQFGNDANGKLTQRDSRPWDGYFPTREWPVGTEIDDPHTLTLPARLAPGDYRIFVSMYALENGQAKPLATPTGEPGVVAGPLTVRP
ncbi:MAG TPA: DUF2079 domain-containing protein [Chloroflexota bacterium]|nr:DUF2079 domain-containing protein [Chloroflexota bacterium]